MMQSGNIHAKCNWLHTELLFNTVLAGQSVQCDHNRFRIAKFVGVHQHNELWSLAAYRSM